MLYRMTLGTEYKYSYLHYGYGLCHSIDTRITEGIGY